MAALEQVTQMRGQGMSDDQITSALQQQGVPPKEITDALNQSNIKNAVAGGGDVAPEAAPAGGEAAGGGAYTPQTQDYSQYQGGAEAAGGDTAPTEYYEEAPYAAGQAGVSSDTMIELATQVFSEKIKKTSKTVDELSEFKSLAEVKLESIDTRLKRIEKIIDTIQIKVLEKVGAFASELQKTQKELDMVENSVAKVAGSKAAKSSKKTTSKKSSSKKK